MDSLVDYKLEDFRLEFFPVSDLNYETLHIMLTPDIEIIIDRGTEFYEIVGEDIDANDREYIGHAYDFEMLTEKIKASNTYINFNKKRKLKEFLYG